MKGSNKNKPARDSDGLLAAVRSEGMSRKSKLPVMRHQPNVEIIKRVSAASNGACNVTAAVSDTH